MQGTDADVLAGHFFLGNTVGLAHTDDLVRGQRATAHAALMATAVHFRFQTDARLAAHIQGANALGAIGLVRGQAHQVDRQCRQVDVHTAGGLRRVRMKDHALFAADGTNGGHVLDHADFVVDEHDAGQNGVGAYGRLEHLQIQHAVGLHLQIGHFKALALQLAAGVEHGLVLGLHRDQVLALGLVEMRSTLQGQVIGFGGTGGPDDLARVGTDQGGHLLAALFNGGFGFPTPGVAAGCRIAKVVAQPGNHGVHHPLIAGVGGAVVHVNRKVGRGVHGSLSSD